jgi:hypothetical protein
MSHCVSAATLRNEGCRAPWLNHVVVHRRMWGREQPHCCVARARKEERL